MFKLIWFIRYVFYKLLFIRSDGWRSYLGRPVFSRGLKGLRVGQNFRLFPNWRIETHDNGKIIIEDDVSVGHGLHLVAVKHSLVIGQSTVISSNVLITNSDHGYQALDTPVHQQAMFSQETRIGKNCFIGAGAKILPGTVLGNQCIVGANAVVKGHFPDYCVISGAPARIIKQFDPALKAWVKINQQDTNVNSSHTHL